MSNGKGDTPRPLSVKKKIYDERWENTFGKKENNKKENEDASKRDKN